ncbi:substrate-binding domain-containing protein [Sinorhizobium medicae]
MRPDRRFRRRLPDGCLPGREGPSAHCPCNRSVILRRSDVARADGFEQGLADHGATPDPGLRFEGSYLAPSGKAAAEWLLAGHGGDLPSAVFFGNYLMAAGALAEFYDRGIRIPDDFKVAVFGDQPQLEYVRPRLTRVGNAPAELARRATRMLLERINGTYEGEPRSEVVSCVLREFETA